MKTYLVKLNPIFEEIGLSDFDCLNLVAKVSNHVSSRAYRKRQEVDEFHLVKFKILHDGPIAYTKCHSPNVASQRFYDELSPLLPLTKNRKKKFDLDKFKQVLYNSIEIWQVDENGKLVILN